MSFSLYLSSSTLCKGLFLSIHMYNAVHVLLPIMLSISVFLLIAGWKGVRGGLSQLIHHIKYQPSSTFLSLFHSPVLPYLSSLTFFFSFTPFSSPPTISISPAHLSSALFLSPVFPPSLSLTLRSLSLLPQSPPALFWRFPSLSHFFFNKCHMPLHPTSRLPIMTLSPYPSHPSPYMPYIQACTLSLYHVRFGVICKSTICLIIQKNPVMQKDFRTNHNNGFWQCSTLIFWR